MSRSSPFVGCRSGLGRGNRRDGGRRPGGRKGLGCAGTLRLRRAPYSSSIKAPYSSFIKAGGRFSQRGACAVERQLPSLRSLWPGCLHTHRIDFRSHHANCTCYGSVTSQLTSQLTTSWYRRHKSDACLTPPWALRAPRLYVYVLCQASRDLRDEPSPPRAPALRDQSRAVHRRSLHASLAPAPEDGYAEQRSRSLSASWEALLASSVRTASLN